MNGRVARGAQGASPVIVIAPDSFKGSLDAAQVAHAMAQGVLRAVPQARVIERPMADGGEGTLAAILAAAAVGARRVTWSVRSAAGHATQAVAAILADGTGVIEVAQVVGLTDPRARAVAVEHRDTRGVGELMLHLLDAGCRTLMIGLGGSSTNDGGAGMLAALGVQFRDATGAAVAPTPAGLAQLAAVELAALDPRLATCTLGLMSDVNNPLTGMQGATAVFGPQKGVAAGSVGRIDATLLHYAELTDAAFARTIHARPGAGAAGGLGYALQLLGATFSSGADVIADIVGLDVALNGATWALTGEGRSDAQTAMRKAPWVVAERGRAQRVPVSLLSGSIDTAALPGLAAHFAGCFALAPGPGRLDDSLAHAAAWLADRAEAMARLRFG